MSATTSTPSTPEHDPPQLRPGSMLRSSTVPARLMTDPSTNSPPHGSSTPSAADKDAEYLYTRAGSKIVSFSTGLTGGARARSDSGKSRDSDASLLPWKIAGERTMAVGTLEIYRLRSSGVGFLKFGNLVHPIMPMSQCWCVDGESKFVLRIRDGAYYRLELPWGSSEDIIRVEEFKDMLGKVLRYEKTPCPFKRGFHVELPEMIDESPTRVRIKRTSSQAKRWKLRGVWMPEDAPDRSDGEYTEHLTPTAELSESSSFEDESEGSTTTERDSQEVRQHDERPSKTTILREEWRRRELQQGNSVDSSSHEPPQAAPRQVPHSLHIRSVTAPLPSTTLSDDNEDDAAAVPEELDRSDAVSIASSLTSFHTAYEEDRYAPLSATSVYSEDDALATPRPQELQTGLRVPSVSTAYHHSRDASDATVIAKPISGATVEHASTPSTPSPPALITDHDDTKESPPWHDAVTPPDTMLRMRRLQRNVHRSTADLTAAMAYSPGVLSTETPGRGRQLTSAIVQKVYTLILGPADHLVAMMLRIAERIVKGAKIFHPFDLRKPNERMAGGWDDSEDDRFWDEDDFGIPLQNTRSNASVASDSNERSQVTLQADADEEVE